MSTINHGCSPSVCTRIGEQGPIVARMGHIVLTTVAGRAGWRGRSPLWMREIAQRHNAVVVAELAFACQFSVFRGHPKEVINLGA